MIAIGWLWVAFMMAIAEKSVVAGVLTFVLYGLLPCGVLLYLLNKHAGKRRDYLAQKREQERVQAEGEAVNPAQTPEPPSQTPDTRA